jgi:hypothetical protein
MSLTIKQAISAYEALSLLIAKDKEDKYIFASAIRIKFALNLRKVKDVVEEFSKEHNALVKAHGTEQKDGTFKVEDPEKLKVFNIERNNLLEQDSDVTLSPIEIKDLGDNQVAIDLIVVLLETGLLKE